MTWDKRHTYCCSIIVCMFFFACTGGYKFTNANAPSDAKTIAITLFYNESPGGPPDLSQTFTEAIREYFQQNTKLSVTKDPLTADLILEGNIVSYLIQPVAPVSDGSTETAAQQKLVIDVQASYTNNLNEKDNFNQRFSAFALFDGEKTLSEVENEKIEEITEQLVLKIFNKSFDNW